MDPYLRPAPTDDEVSPPCPPGHTAQPAGLWSGEHQEVVYDPRRHDVCFMRGGLGADVDDGLRSTGWEPTANDGTSQLWVRDRAAAMLQMLDAPEPTASAPARGLGR